MSQNLYMTQSKDCPFKFYTIKTNTYILLDFVMIIQCNNKIKELQWLLTPPNQSSTSVNKNHTSRTFLWGAINKITKFWDRKNSKTFLCLIDKAWNLWPFVNTTLGSSSAKWGADNYFYLALPSYRIIVLVALVLPPLTDTSLTIMQWGGSCISGCSQY